MATTTSDAAAGPGPVADEKVLCFPRSALATWQDGAFGPEFLTFAPDGVFRAIPRRLLEDDPRFKQIITYCVIEVGSETKTPLYGHYLRGKSGGESRLHRLRSLGVGGHMADSGPIPDTIDQFIVDSYDAMNVEFCEEVSVDRTPLFRNVGLINYDGDEVGQVHVGIVFRCRLPAGTTVVAIEDCLDDLRFDTWDMLVAGREQFEPWSKLLIDAGPDFISGSSA